jgi:hypothetical protein
MKREDRLDHHSKFVSDWIRDTTKGLVQEELLLAFEKAFNRLLDGTRISISEVTMDAVLDRILDNCAESYPMMNQVFIEKTRFNFDDLRSELSKHHDEEIKSAFHYLITDFLFVIGNLTGELLTPQLHLELLKKDDL